MNQKKLFVKKHPVRYNQNVAGVAVPICDPCWDGWHSACEGGNYRIVRKQE